MSLLSSGSQLSHEQIASVLGIHRSRVGQIEKDALAKVRRALLRLGFDGSEIPYVRHALSEYADEDHLTLERKTQRRIYFRDRARRIRRANRV